MVLKKKKVSPSRVSFYFSMTLLLPQEGCGHTTHEYGFVCVGQKISEHENI